MTEAGDDGAVRREPSEAAIDRGRPLIPRDSIAGGALVRAPPAFVTTRAIRPPPPPLVCPQHPKV